MKCKIISVSHKPADWERKAIEFYSKQLPNHFDIKHVEVKPLSKKSMTEKSVLKNEEKEILNKVDHDAFLILCDRQGQRMSSIEFANLIKEKSDLGTKINFVIGGAFGVSEKLIKISNLAISASDLTFPHRLFKILLIEQIFRASAINKNHPYHK
ncbi:MAG: rRNA methyltransferase [Gammaproteobacteria bacterium]|nr:rRNA methyltransferase [Gammaproteobacteria bacterium]